MNEKYLESIKIVDGIVLHLEWHQKRVESVMHSLGWKSHSLDSYIQPPKTRGVFRCRVVYGKNSVDVTYTPYIKRNIQKLKLVYDDTVEYSKKFANREELERLFLLREDCDDIIVVKNGYLSDTTIANIAFFDGQQWLTPKKPLLAGTTRARLLYEKKIFEQNITPLDIKAYQKVALMNAMIDFDIITQENSEDIIC